jgi:hypothetical protein
MSKMSDGGKGSSPRPFSINQDEYEKRWDYIFSRDLKKDESEEKVTRNNQETQEVLSKK